MNSRNSGKLKFREFEISEDSDVNVGEEAAREGKKTAERAATTVRNNVNKNIQKQRLRREYVRRVQEAEQKREATKKAAAKAKGVAGKTATAVKKHPDAISVLGIIGGLILVVFYFSSTVSSCSTVAFNGISGILMASYFADDSDIDDAELKYTEWETDLRLHINNTEFDCPYYDEYKYNLDSINHSPYERHSAVICIRPVRQAA